jgi:hypothetical protein
MRLYLFPNETIEILHLHPHHLPLSFVILSETSIDIEHAIGVVNFLLESSQLSIPLIGLATKSLENPRNNLRLLPLITKYYVVGPKAPS